MNQTDQQTPETTPAARTQSAGRSLAGRIVGWTNNILATSVAAVVMLAVGMQLVSWWGDHTGADARTAGNSSHSLPVLESCAIEFGNRPYALVRSTISGNRDRAIRELGRRCIEMLDADPDPLQTIGVAEQKMLNDSTELEPVHSRRGRWRLFQVENPQQDGLPMMIGIRDDCRGKSVSRMVVWGLAFPKSAGDWTLFACRTAPESSKSSRKMREFPLPDGSQQTLAIGDHNGSWLIGFSGGEPGSAMRHFNRLADQRNWKIQRSWQKTGIVWQAGYMNMDQGAAVNVQLAVERGQNLRGLLLIDQPEIGNLERKPTE